MVLHWPQIVLLLIYAYRLWVAIGRHGTTSTVTLDARHTVIHVAIVVWLLYSGGFFGMRAA
jgi:hypothetical protein